MFETIPHGFPFVQIMHVSNSHWITVSNVNTNKKNLPFRDAVIGGGICLKVGGGTRKIIIEMHVQMRAGNDCNYSQYCSMFLKINLPAAFTAHLI